MTEATRAERGRRTAHAALAAVALAMGGLTFAYRYLAAPRFPNDHFVHLSSAQQMLFGDLPIRDFVDRGITLMAVQSAVGQIVFGPGLHSEHVTIALVLAVAAALTVVAAAWVSGSTVAGTAAALVTVLAFPIGYSYPKLLLYAAACVAAWLYLSSPTRLRLSALAAVVVIAFLFRHDHGVLLAAGGVVMLAAHHGLSRQLATNLAWFVAVGLILISPYVLWVQVHHGMVAYAADGIAFWRREAQRATWFELPTFGTDPTQPFSVRIGEGPVVNVRWAPELADGAIAEGETRHRLTRRDPVGPNTWQYELSAWSRASIERLVRDPAVADTHGIDRGAFTLDVPAPHGLAAMFVGWRGPGPGLRARANGVAALFYGVWLLPGLAALLAASQWRVLTPQVRSAVVMLIAVQLGMNLSMLRDPLDLRIRDVVVPAAVLLAFAATTLWRLRGGSLVRVPARAGALSIAGVFLVAAAGAGPFDAHAEESHLARGWDGIRDRIAEVPAEFAPPAERTGKVSPAIAQLVSYIRTCTAPDARLFTMTFAPELLFFTGRGFAAGQVTLIPGYYATERHATLMLERLARERVPLVIMDSDTREEMAAFYPRVVAHVAGRYQEFGRVPVGPGKNLILLAQVDPAPAGRWGPAGWPCFAGSGVGHG